MAKQTINIGQAANDRTGDPLRSAFTKINANFTELYDRAVNTDAQTLTLTGDTLAISGGNTVDLGKYVDNIFSGDYNDLTNKPTIPADISNLTDTQGLLDNLYASIPTAGSEIDIDFDQSLIEITLNQTINTIDFVNIPLAGTTKSTTVVFIQDASGNRTVSGLGYLTQGGIGLQLSATANSISVINFTAYGSTIIGFNVGQDYQ